MSSRVMMLAATLAAATAASVAAGGVGREATAGSATHRDFHGTVVWAHRMSHTFGLRTATHGTMRFVTTARTRYDHLAGFEGCRDGRQLAVHARRMEGAWMAIEIRRETVHRGAWHDGHHDARDSGGDHGDHE